MNPTLQPLDKAIMARYVGDHVSTSIRRNSYCRVQGVYWWLSQVEVIERLEPNNMKVEAYYLTDEEGLATDVWIYQGDTLIDKLQNVGTFNTADAEQTDEDVAIFTEQQKKIAHFGKYVRDHAVARVGVAAVAQQHTLREEVTDVPEVTENLEFPDYPEDAGWRFKDERDAINDI